MTMSRAAALRLAFVLPALLAASLALPAVGQALDDEAKEVVKLFATAYGDECTWDSPDSALDNPPRRWPLSWALSYSDEIESATLYELYCFSGAYNSSYAYYLVPAEDYYPIQSLAFAEPEFEVVYENDDFEGAVEDIVIEGMTAKTLLINPVFDPDTGTLTEYAYWRGLGDASSVGVWRFDEGRFVLKTYDVDASYDGEVNPTRLVDYE